MHKVCLLCSVLAVTDNRWCEETGVVLSAVHAERNAKYNTYVPRSTRKKSRQVTAGILGCSCSVFICRRIKRTRKHFCRGRRRDLCVADGLLPKLIKHDTFPKNHQTKKASFFG